MSDIPANDHAPRIAVLEEIARGTKAALERIERQLETVQRNARSKYRRASASSLLAPPLSSAVIAHTQHWI